MPFLFDTDAISEPLKKRPLPSYVRWLNTIPPEDQFMSAISVGELYRGAFRSPDVIRHVTNIEQGILPNVTVLPYDEGVAHMYGYLYSRLAEVGKLVDDADLQIAATAFCHGLEVVTGNVQHFERIPGIRIHRVLADARLKQV